MRKCIFELSHTLNFKLQALASAEITGCLQADLSVLRKVRSIPLTL